MMKKTSMILLLIMAIMSGEHSQALIGVPPRYATPLARFTANTIRSDFPFPSKFEADFAIAIYDSNGNGYIDTYNAESSATFPYQLTPSSITLGSKIGSPFSIIPGIDDAKFDVGFTGKVIVYAEQIIGGFTTFIWFALPDIKNPPNPTDAWSLDYGIGSFNASDALKATEIYHATLVQDYYTNNGTSDRVGYVPLKFYQGEPSQSLISPNSIGILSLSNISDCAPRSLGDRSSPETPQPTIVAGQIHPALYNRNYFIGMNDIVIDVPLVREEAWDGIYLYKTNKKYARLICSLKTDQIYSIQEPLHFYGWITPIISYLMK
jgi:hypothetical protein